MRHFLLALQFFTRVPVMGQLAAWIGFDQAMLNAASGHFPGVGWIVGAAGAATLAVAAWLLPTTPLGALVAAALATAATVWLTGGFHEDGLADTADGLGGSVTRERALEIMKDSRLGSYGTMALTLALLLKITLVALLAAPAPGAAALALLAAHVLSRLAPLVVMRALPYVSASAQAKSKPLAEVVTRASLLAGCAWSAPALVLFAVVGGALHATFGIALCAGATALMARWLRRRLGGFTGDTLGAVQQVGEIALYLGLALA